MVNPIVGAVPRGEDFFGRDPLIDNMWARLSTDNILLVAPRRFGKTGVMYRLSDRPQAAFRPLYMNVEHILTPADFIVELLALLLRDKHFRRIGVALWRDAKGFGRFVRDLPLSIDVGGIKVELRQKSDVPEHWLNYGERLIGLLSQQAPQLLLLLDEFAVMIDHIARDNIKDAEQLLRWFRAARIAPDTRTRFVIGGSINLVSTLDSMSMVDTVNDLSVERLKPFDDYSARAFVKAVFETRNIYVDDEVVNRITALVGSPVPYLLAVFLTAILDRARTTGDGLSIGMVETAFEEDLLGGATSIVFQHYRSRLDQYYRGQDIKTAKSILGYLSRAEKPIREATLYRIYLKSCNRENSNETRSAFKMLMNQLDNDFYISIVNGRYDFFSRVLKLWWKTHYGFQKE